MEPFTIKMERLEDGTIFLSCDELESVYGNGRTFIHAAAEFYRTAIDLKLELLDMDADELDKRWNTILDRLIEFLRIMPNADDFEWAGKVLAGMTDEEKEDFGIV